MPKRFDEKEKLQIRQKLLNAGRRLFTQYGVKKTNVSELTTTAGIAAGSFYTFYRSKEELFFDLLEEEEQNIQGRLLRKIEGRPMTKSLFKTFLQEGFTLLTENPFFKQVMLADQLETVIRRLPPDRLERNYNQDQHYLLPLVKQWQADGLLREANPELIVSMIRSVIMLSLHKKEIGEQVYGATLELLIDTLAEGLFARDREYDRHD